MLAAKQNKRFESPKQRSNQTKVSKLKTTSVLLPSTLMAMAKRVFFVFVVLTILTSVYSITRGDAQQARAATPATLNFQARLMTSSGNLVPDGNYNIEFKLYNASSSTGSSQGACTGDTNCLWAETRTGGNQVQVKNGYLSAYLGDVTALPTNIWDQQLWLTMNIGGTGTATWDGEMTPRIRMTSVPYAFQAKSAETLNKNTGLFTGTVDFATLTADRRYLFPDTSLATTASPGTICVYNGAASNCPAASGSAYYIQNDTVLQTQSNFNMQGRDNGVNGSVVGTFQGAAAGQTADLVQFKASGGTVLGAVTASGDLQVASSIDTRAGGVLSIGTTSATQINVGKIGVNSTIKGSLTVDQNFTVANTGRIAFLRNTTDYTAVGTQNDVNFGTGALFRITSVSPVTITSIADGTDGRIITLVNASANTVTLNNDAGGTAANRIITGTGGNIDVPTGSTVQITYDSGSSRWRVIGGTATSGGGANRQLSNLSGTVAVNASLNPGASGLDLGAGANNWRTLYTDTSVLSPLVGRATAGTLAIGTDANSTAVTISRTGVATTIAGSLSVGEGISATNAGNVAFQNGGTVDYTTVGSANNVNFGTGVLFRLNGVSAQTLTGIAGGADGRIITIVNAGATTATLRNLSASSLAANQISTGTSADLRLPSGASVSLAYDSDSLLWRVIGSVAGNSVDTLGTFNGATSYVNGANISGNVLTFGAADGSNPGIVSTGTQTFAGSKTFTGNLQASAGATVSGGIISLTGNAASSFTTTAGALTLTSATAATWSTGAGTLTLQGGDGNVSLGTSTSLSANGALAIRSGGATVLGLDTGGAAEIQIGTANANSILIGKASGQAIRIGQNGGTLQLDGTNFDVSTAGVVTVAGSQSADVTSQAGTTLTVKPGAATGFNVAGAALMLQGGTAGTGNANGGAVTITGGAGVGTGSQGLVNLSTTAFSTSLIQTFGSSGVQAFNNPDNSIINNFSTIPVTASTTGVIVSVPDPAQSAIGRIVYVSARSGSNDFTLRLNASRVAIDIAMKANSTATLIWNGTDWTAAGASSSTDLQSAYNNTLTSAGGAEIVLNPTGGAADGFTIRNNGTTPIIGGLLEVQSSVGTNLFSVNSRGVELAANGGAETSSTYATDWTAAPAGGTVTRTTNSTQYVTGQAGVQVATAAANQGVRNNLSGSPEVSTTYTVSFTAKASVDISANNLNVQYSRDGGTDLEPCSSYSTQNVGTTSWTKVTCTILTDGTAATNPDLIIRQADGIARNIWIDNLSFLRNDNTTQPSNVQVGGGLAGGPVTLFTLDRASAPPVAAGDETYYGSMYYDTITGSIQCYEADGWGACGSPPDNIITLTPEYTGAVLNGNGIGVMTADICANQATVLTVGTLCSVGEARNYYRWTSPQASLQDYSIYVTYKLPTTFKEFASNDTMKLTAYRDDIDNTDALVKMATYRKNSAGGLSLCGTETNITQSSGSWEQRAVTGSENSCGFNGGDYIIFKITMSSRNNTNVYVENLDFTFNNR